MSEVATAYQHDFSIVSRPCRIHAGNGALSKLPFEVDRQGAARAFVICGRSVARNSDLIGVIHTQLGSRFVGCFDLMGKHSPIEDVIAARDAARAARAEILIAVGGGSVVQGTRAVAIALSEKQPIEELATIYPVDGRPVSPRLNARKLPIINVLTVGTSAQNRSGSPLKLPGGQHRLELYDPKTRPVAIFWDTAALMTAPIGMVRDSAGAIFWRAAMNVGYERAPPLVDFNRRHVFKMMRSVLPRLEAPDAEVRLDLCVATFLQNRDLDDGGQRVNHWPSKVTYAFAAGLFHRHDHVSQGAANAAFTSTAIRLLGHLNPEEMCRIAEAMGVWSASDPKGEAIAHAADALDATFKSIGLPTSLSQLDIPRNAADAIIASALRNYNSDPEGEFQRAEPLLRRVLEASW
jgi:alcohol dehydrogenase class IV